MLIRLQDISVVYPIAGHAPKTVLSRLNLDIHPGEFVTVCGQTGCGKSTMLRLILGSERPTTGHVLIDGVELQRPDRNRGYVPQKYSLFPDRTVLDNITFGPEMEEFGLLGRLTPRFRIQRRELRAQAFNLLSQVGLHPSDAHKYPHQLSGGMQQRVAIAQALIMQPKILLMDEAFSALDPGTRAEMQHLLRNVHAITGSTILFVTHNIDEALTLGTRVIVLGKANPESGANITLDMAVPGQPQPHILERMSAQIEESASAGRQGAALAAAIA
jgi:NitT/TauT family transport system ATP-binding protein